MSDCRYCGKQVRFVVVAEGSEVAAKQWSRPLDVITRAVLFEGEEIVQTERLRPHHCAEQEAAEQREREQWARGSQMPRRQMDAREMIARALEHDCETCGAVIGASCMNLTARKQGREIPTVWPHPKRLALIEGET